MIKNIEKLDAEIQKTNAKITEYINRLRDLERWRREAENAQIVAMVRGVETDPAKIRAFLDEYKQQQNMGAETALGKEITGNET